MSDARSIRDRAEEAFRTYLAGIRAGHGADPVTHAVGLEASVADEFRSMVADYEALRNPETPASEALPAGREALPGRRFGDFQLLRELGRGGMGVVWEAEQLSLGRRVALKVLYPHLSAHGRWIERFQREAQAGGRLRHPGIVAVFAVGEVEGTHFLVEELVPGGETLGDWIARWSQRDDLGEAHYREVAELFASIADALQAAHDAGVIHRDVKPGNILMDHGHPRVADFGVARLQDDLGMSRSGESLGTPYYMSPEQVAPRRLPLDHRCDVFSLGASLYEALTFVRPFQGDTSQQIVEKILWEDPPDPRAIRSRVPRELAIVCAKALEKQRERRYADMGAFGDDLRRFLRSEPIVARPPGPFVRGQKWLRRHPALAAAGGVAAVAILGLTWAFMRAESERDRADDAASRASYEARTSERTMDFLAQLFLSARPNEEGRHATAEDLLDLGAQRLREELVEEPEVRSTLLLVVGESYAALGNAKAAAPLMEEALEIRSELFGLGDQRTFESMNKLAHILVSLARFEEAEKYYRQAAEGHRLLYGDDSAEYLENQGNLANLLFSSGRQEEALPLCRQSLEGCIRRYGEESGITMGARSNLAAVLTSLDLLEEAEEQLRIALDYTVRRQGEESPRATGEMHVLAHLLRKRGRLEEAEAQFRKNIEICDGIYESHHPHSLGARHGLAMVLTEQDEYAEAESIMEDVVEGREAALGPRHPRTLAALAGQVRLLMMDDAWREAEVKAKELLQRTPLDDSTYRDRVELLEQIKSELDAISASGG